MAETRVGAMLPPFEEPMHQWWATGGGKHMPRRKRIDLRLTEQ